MPLRLGLQFREQLTGPLQVVQDELDQVIAALNVWRDELVTFQTQVGFNSTTLTLSGPTEIKDELDIRGTTRWKSGPWYFDFEGNNTFVAAIRPPQITATQNNYNPPGRSTCIIIEVTSDAARSITGLDRIVRQKQLVMIGNRGSNDITLVHASGSSLAYNQFSLPGSVDIVLAANQYSWFYYDVGSEVWRHFGGSPNKTGGLLGAGSTSFPASLPTSGLVTVSVSLSLSDLQTIDTTAKVVVAAPGSGIVVVPVSWSVHTNTTTASGGPAPNYQLRWNGLATDPLANLNSGANAIQDVFDGDASFTIPLTTVSNIDNKALEVSFSLDIGGTFVGSATLVLIYYLRTLSSVGTKGAR